ncbi:MAG TPA: type II 3-dehydroquinate dehydratase [Rhizomicrobium sp.]|jgi:3-dehydroquinate dehydratase-2|nr:type II 3-dehydroquinate dehydratase [Rhizomicrobium sp.]
MAKKTNQSKTLPIYILNGPNLNLLGEREPEVYGYTTLAQIGKMCADQAAQYGLATVFHQSNHEGEIVDQLQEARTSGSGLIINPAGYGHTSIAILDSILALKIPVIEVHLSNIHRRDPFRNHSYVSKGATGIIMGLGAQGYLRAVDAIAEILKVKT